MLMKNIILTYMLLLLVFIASSGKASAQCNTAPGHRPRVGLVLSGGGAKGAAHIGVIRAVEQAGIPIDYIAGTSMGAIVGGLYAMGYTTDELEQLVKMQDWEMLLSDKSPRKQLSPEQRERKGRYILNVPLSRSAKPKMDGFVRGRNLGNMLARLTVGYHDSISFDSLKIPFACVATNLANGDEVVLRSGKLSAAIRASMAIPGVFTPVVMNGKTLVDGGLCNNFPVDVARRMGADIVIGSTVQRVFNDTMQQGGIQSVVQQLISISSRRKFEENIRLCNVHIGVNPKGVSTMDFSPEKLDTMIRRGYETAMQQQRALQQIALVAGVNFPYDPKRCFPGWSSNTSPLTPKTDTVCSKRQPDAELAGNPNCVQSSTISHAGYLTGMQSDFQVNRISFDRITPAEERIIRKACKLAEQSRITQQQIEHAVTLLNERFLYLDAHYSLIEAEQGYHLVFHAHERLASELGVAARFDTEELAAILLNANFVFRTQVPTTIDLSARLTEQYAVRSSLTVEPWLNKQLNVFYEFRHRDIDVNHKGRRASSLVFQQQQAGLSYAYRQTRNFDAELGIKFQRLDFSDILMNDEGFLSAFPRPVSDNYFTGYARLNYNSQDKAENPTVGSKFVATCTFTTDNLVHLKRPHAFSTVSASWQTVIAFGKRFALLPRLSGRMVFGKKVPFIFRNAAGGYIEGKYLEQQIPFVGLSHIELFRNALVSCDVKFRYHFLTRHYATLLASVLAEQRDVRHLKKAHYAYGIGLHYGYETKFGPVQAALSYSGECRKPTFYMSVGFDF